jgi:FAD/FMN-containing dehydrogenase
MTDAQTVIKCGEVDAFQASLHGELLRPSDAGYDEARRVWNGMIDKRPGFIARYVGVADVIAAVSSARTHHLLVSVRGGGHNIPGNAVCHSGLMIDLARIGTAWRFLYELKKELTG